MRHATRTTPRTRASPIHEAVAATCQVVDEVHGHLHSSVDQVLESHDILVHLEAGLDIGMDGKSPQLTGLREFGHDLID
jgi:hypothetical protein